MLKSRSRLFVFLVSSCAGAFINFHFSFETAFGISFLAGNWLGVIAGLAAPWPLGILGPFITMLPTVYLWNHPWALGSVLLEGFLISHLSQKNRLDRVIVSETFYWPLIGAPLVFLQYTYLLKINVSGAFAAATKQGINSIANVVIGIVVFYVLQSILGKERNSRHNPSAREYLVLFLNLFILVPILTGVFYYTLDRKERNLHFLEQESALVLSIATAEWGSDLPDTMKRASLTALIKSAGHEYVIFDVKSGAIEAGTDMRNLPWYTAPKEILLRGSDTPAVVGRAGEANPMKRWSGAFIRAYQDLENGKRIVVAQPIMKEVSLLNNSLTRILTFLYLWLAAASAAAYFLASILIHPLDRLRKTAALVQTGKGSFEWPNFFVIEIQELRDSLVAMTGALEHRNMELIEAKKAADGMTKSSKKYVSFMGHELKAPLAAIQSSLEVDDGKNVRLNLELYKKTISRLLELIDDILDQAKSSEGSMKLHIASFNPAEEAAFLLEPFAIQARRKGLGFSSDIGPELYRPAWGDPLRFRQVIANLVSNAIKYTSAGKIHVRLQGTTAEDGLNITGIIEDTGKGIEAERLEMIWKPFVSAEGILEDGQSSHGLGLSIVRSVIDSMGGEISVSSTPGRGTNFTFTIPLQAMPPEIPLGKISPISEDNHDTNHPQDNKNTGTPDLQGLRVLVADDEKISRLTWNHVFKGWGARVDEAASGDQALRLANSGMYDIIVLDMHMPVMNGLEVLAGLRDFETRAKQKPAFIILSSGEAINPPETADAVLPKPFNREQLKKVLMSRFPGP